MISRSYRQITTVLYWNAMTRFLRMQCEPVKVINLPANNTPSSLVCMLRRNGDILSRDCYSHSDT